MKSNNVTFLVRELMAILFLSVVLAFLYNAFSSKGVSLIRTIPQKNAVSDSALFLQPAKADTAGKDTVKVSTSMGQSFKQKSDSAVGKIKNDGDAYSILTLAQVKRLLDERRALFIDARDAESYKKAHIKSAINMFGDEPEQHFEELVKISRDTLVVVYCNGTDCHLGRSLIKFMTVLGFTQLYLYDEGWDGWQKANMPVEKSSE